MASAGRRAAGAFGRGVEPPAGTERASSSAAAAPSRCLLSQRTRSRAYPGCAEAPARARRRAQLGPSAHGPRGLRPAPPTPRSSWLQAPRPGRPLQRRCGGVPSASTARRSRGLPRRRRGGRPEWRERHRVDHRLCRGDAMVAWTPTALGWVGAGLSGAVDRVVAVPRAGQRRFTNRRERARRPPPSAGAATLVASVVAFAIVSVTGATARSMVSTTGVAGAAACCAAWTTGAAA